MPETQCTHLDRIEVSPPAAGDVEGCEECCASSPFEDEVTFAVDFG